MFWCDGIQWSFYCEITRGAEIKPSEISGLMLDKNYFNDALATYMSYQISAIPDPAQMDEYYQFYELVSEPVDGHNFILPYNGSTIEITARVQPIEDIYEELAGGRVYWRGCKFQVVANHPSKVQGLSGALTRGRAVIPGLNTGDAWIKFYIDDDGILHLLKTPDTALDFYIDEDGILHAVAEGDLLEYTPYFWQHVNIDNGDDILY